MPYATGRIYNDADAHVMEPVNWLASYADAKTRALLKPMDLSNAGKMNEHATASTGKFPASHWDEVDIEKNLMFIKGWGALGAFDPAERTRALDLMGFNRQLVFTSLAMGQFWGVFAQREYNLDLLYGGAAAVNRAISDFCKDDQRLIPVGFLPLDDLGALSGRLTRGSSSVAALSGFQPTPLATSRPPITLSTGFGAACKTPMCRSCCTWARARRRCRMLIATMTAVR